MFSAMQFAIERGPTSVLPSQIRATGVDKPARALHVIEIARWTLTVVQ